MRAPLRHVNVVRPDAALFGTTVFQVAGQRRLGQVDHTAAHAGLVERVLVLLHHAEHEVTNVVLVHVETHQAGVACGEDHHGRTGDPEALCVAQLEEVLHLTCQRVDIGGDHLVVLRQPRGVSEPHMAEVALQLAQHHRGFDVVDVAGATVDLFNVPLQHPDQRGNVRAVTLVEIFTIAAVRRLEDRGEDLSFRSRSLQRALIRPRSVSRLGFRCRPPRLRSSWTRMAVRC